MDEEKKKEPDDGGCRFFGVILLVGIVGMIAAGFVIVSLHSDTPSWYPIPDVPEEHKIECQQCMKEFIPNMTKEDAFGFYWWLAWHEPSEEERYDAEYIAGKWVVLRQCNCACLHHNCEVKS